MELELSKLDNASDSDCTSLEVQVQACVSAKAAKNGHAQSVTLLYTVHLHNIEGFKNSRLYVLGCRRRKQFKKTCE